jgi:hypothetical protein
MKLQEQQIRELLNAQRFEVNPQHEAAFRAMLDGKKTRRRTGLLFFIFLVTGAGLIAFSWGQYGDAISKSSQHDSSQSISINKALQATEHDGQASYPIVPPDTDASTIAPEAQANADPVNSEMISTAQVSGILPAESQSTSPIPANVSGNAPSRNTANNGNRNNSGTQQPEPYVPDEMNDAHPAFSKETKVSDQTEASTEIIGTDNGATTVPDAHTQNGDVDNGIVGNTIADSEAITTEKASGNGEIIPATRLVMKSRFALGAALAWAPVGITWNNSGLSTGNQFQFTGFGTYRIDPRWSVRADAGIGNQRGGFTFNKSSENEVFGFGLSKERHEMHADQLYSVFLSAEMGRDIGKHQVFGGLQGIYLYGARGDIRSEELSLDVPFPIPRTSENVWVSVSDLQQFSMQAFLGLRTPITSRIHLATSVRIPLLNTIRLASDAGAYDYEIQSPGIAPMLGLSYQLYQQ